MSTTLTPIQRKVLGFICRTMCKRYRFPVLREISEHMRWATTRAAHFHLAMLVRKGFLAHDGHGDYRVVGLTMEPRFTNDECGERIKAIAIADVYEERGANYRDEVKRRSEASGSRLEEAS